MMDLCAAATPHPLHLLEKKKEASVILVSYHDSIIQAAPGRVLTVTWNPSFKMLPR